MSAIMETITKRGICRRTRRKYEMAQLVMSQSRSCTSVAALGHMATQARKTVTPKYISYDQLCYASAWSGFVDERRETFSMLQSLP